MRLADYVMQYIWDIGVEHVFTLVGGHAMSLNDALAHCPRLARVGGGDLVCSTEREAIQ
jgi:TPP-dependent 2-oxoacid decarboxylase